MCNQQGMSAFEAIFVSEAVGHAASVDPGAGAGAVTASGPRLSKACTLQCTCCAERRCAGERPHHPEEPQPCKDGAVVPAPPHRWRGRSLRSRSFRVYFRRITLIDTSYSSQHVLHSHQLLTCATVSFPLQPHS